VGEIVSISTANEIAHVDFHVGDLRPGDWPAAREIYLEGIATGNATFETAAPEWDTWDAAHLRFGRLACRDVDERLLGWAALSPASRRHVYRGVAEVSIYISASARGKGLGRLLLLRLIDVAEANGVWMLQANIFPENAASVALHRKCGFRIVGHRERIGAMNGVWRDNVLLERRSAVVGV
jgi:phosphinothricin acetyltransferase